jgi:flavin-dependent dehydrogenase
MYDIIVIGAGPAGSSVANIVSSGKYKVLVLEKETFPRYHIGESLIPFTYEPLQRLGVIGDLKASSFIKKYSVQFVQPDGTEHTPFYFYNRYDKDTIAQTWQVDRASFDNMLISKAQDNGAVVYYNTKVETLLYENNTVIGVEYTDLNNNTKHKVYAKWVVDASGRAALASKANKWQNCDSVLSNKMAIWTYYKGCQRPEGLDAGATIVAFIKNKGWFWYIPLANDITSIGVVAESQYLMRNGVSNIKNAFEREIQQNKWLYNKIQGTVCLQDHKATTDYSKQSNTTVTPGLVLVGDAYAFLDPVFSSGVLLALKSGVMVGEVLLNSLDNNTLCVDSFKDYTHTINTSLENMRKLVHAFYNVNISFKDIIALHPWVADKITDCLSGDLNKDYSDLWAVLL